MDNKVQKVQELLAQDLESIAGGAFQAPPLGEYSLDNLYSGVSEEVSKYLGEATSGYYPQEPTYHTMEKPNNDSPR
ncbi:MAG: hypothetical protein HC780_08560 [Leptolyngbyaceae cyanobacterium CSU_1_3]|nr:hypothetical protein [Leptolyngbyaceae cyanobacterium CSU_1_3]